MLVGPCKPHPVRETLECGKLLPVATYCKRNCQLISSAMLVRSSNLGGGARAQEFERKELQILKGEVPHQIDILAEVTACTSTAV